MKQIRIALGVLLLSASAGYASEEAFSKFIQCASDAVSSGAGTVDAVKSTCSSQWDALTQQSNQETLSAAEELTQKAISAQNQ